MAFLRAALVAILLPVIPTVATAQSRVPSQAGEYDVKAAILYNLLKFVEWPADAFAAANTPVAICVLGADPFGALLDDSVRGHQVGGRGIVVRRLTEVAPGCHVLFISLSETRRLSMILDRLRTMSVLTVGEQEQFVDGGGIIELRTEDRVRFAINVEAADRARLRLSARLLMLALPPRPPQKEAR